MVSFTIVVSDFYFTFAAIFCHYRVPHSLSSSCSSLLISYLIATSLSATPSSCNVNPRYLNTCNLGISSCCLFILAGSASSRPKCRCSILPVHSHTSLFKSFPPLSHLFFCFFSSCAQLTTSSAKHVAC